MERACAGLMTWVLALAVAGCGGGGGAEGNGSAQASGASATTFSKSFGGAGFDEARAAIRTTDGGYAFVGTVDGDREGKSTDLWISKLDANGNVEWQRAVGGRASSDADRRRAFTVVRGTPDGGTVVAGQAGDPPSQPPDPPQPGPTGKDLWIAKFNAAGLIEWQRDLDSGAWPGKEFAPANYGRGDFADDKAEDLRPLPDGGFVVAGRSTGNVIDPATNAVTVNAESVFVARLDAQGQVLWQRRLAPDGTYASAPVVQATSDSGALLVYAGTFGEQVHMRVVRLDAAGNTRWQVDAENGHARAVLQTRDAGFAIVFDPFGGDSKVLRLDPAGGVLWSKAYGPTSLYAADERCIAADAGGATQCELFVAGSLYVEGVPDDNVQEPRAHVLRLDASGDRVAQRTFEDDAHSHSLGDIVRLDDDHVAVIERAGDRAARRLVLDATTLATQVASQAFELLPSRPDVNPVMAHFGSGTQIFASHPTLQQWRQFASAQPLSGTVSLQRTVDLQRQGADDAAVAVVEIARGSFIVSGNSTSFGEGLAAPWVVRVTDGRVDWQRRVDAAPGSALRAMARSADGGVILAVNNGDTAQLIELTAQGQLGWRSQALSGEFEWRELQAVDSSGLVAVGTLNPSESVIASGFVLRFDGQGRLLWQRRYDRLRGDSIAPVDEDGDGEHDDGFVVAASDEGSNALVTVLRLDAAGDVSWARDVAVNGATPAPPHAAKVRQAADGGYVIGTTDFATIAPLQSGQPHGQANVTLVKLDRDGQVAWVQSYGAFLDERLHDLQALPDGGVLVAGASDSLGSRSEAWLLRLGADGLLAPGCNAHLGSLPVAAVSTQARAVTARVLQAAPAAEPALTAPETSAAAITPDIAEARQCVGSADAAPPGAREDEPRFTLTLEQPGSRTGVVTSTPAALVCGTADRAPPCSASFPAGGDVFLSVEIGSTEAFLRWEGCDELLAPDSGGASRCRVRMDRDRTVRAVFGQAQDRFRVSVSVVGTGSVRSGDEGIRCGVFYGAAQDCDHTYDRLIAGTDLPTSITLAVFTHAEGFQGWGGDCKAQGRTTAFNLLVDSDKHCIAMFAGPPPTAFDLTVNKTGSGSGSIVSAPAGIECGEGCSASFVVGQTVRLLASEDAGSSFDGWSGCDRLVPSPTGSSAVCEVDMNASRSVSASFNRPPGGGQYLLEVVAQGQDGIVESNDHGIVCTAAGPDCQQLYTPGTTVTLSFNLLRAAGTFQGWGGDCAGFGSAASATVLMNGNKRCTARFSSPS